MSHRQAALQAEYLVSEYLKANLPNNKVGKVVWCNAEEEQGKPYDIFVEEVIDAENVLRRFIEVKKLAPKRTAFHISTNELLCCEKIARAKEPGVVGRYEVIVVRATDAMLRGSSTSRRVQIVTIHMEKHLRSNQPLVQFAKE